MDRIGFGRGDTQPGRRAVARRCGSLTGRLRTVEELASVGEVAGGKIAANLHSGSASRATPTGRVAVGVRARLRSLQRDAVSLADQRQTNQPGAERQETKAD